MKTQDRKQTILVPIRQEVSPGKFRWHTERRSAEDVFDLGLVKIAAVYSDGMPHIFDYNSGVLISEPHHFGMFFDDRMLPDDYSKPTYKIVRDPKKQNFLNYRGFAEFINRFEGDGRMRINSIVWPKLNGDGGGMPTAVIGALNAGEADPDPSDLAWLLSMHKTGLFMPILDAYAKVLTKHGIRDVFNDTKVEHLKIPVVRKDLLRWQYVDAYYEALFKKKLTVSFS